MKRSLLFTLFFLSQSLFLAAQTTEKIDTAIVSRIKREGMERSQVMNILHMLTDVHGPRLTNSTGYRNAAEYAKKTLRDSALKAFISISGTNHSDAAGTSRSLHSRT